MEGVDAIARLAAGQHGVVTHAQMHALGESDAGIGRLCASHYLLPVHRGIYAVGHRRLSADGARSAASLSVRDGAPVGRFSAANHLELGRWRPRHGLVEVAADTREAGRRTDIKVLRLASLRPEHVIVERDVRCTSVARTLVDLAGAPDLGDVALAKAIRQAEFQRRLDRGEIARVLAGIARPRGVRRLRALLEMPVGSYPETGLEWRFYDFVRAAGLDEPECQVLFVVGAPPRQIRVDFFWRSAGLVVEVDEEHHQLPAFAKQDRERDDGLRALGLDVERVTKRDLNEDPFGLLARLTSSGRLLSNG